MPRRGQQSEYDSSRSGRGYPGERRGASRFDEERGRWLDQERDDDYPYGSRELQDDDELDDEPGSYRGQRQRPFGEMQEPAGQGRRPRDYGGERRGYGRDDPYSREGSSQRRFGSRRERGGQGFGQYGEPSYSESGGRGRIGQPNWPRGERSNWMRDVDEQDRFYGSGQRFEGGRGSGPYGADDESDYEPFGQGQYGLGRYGSGRSSGERGGFSYPGSGEAGGRHFRGRGPQNYQRSDDRIREDVCDRLTDDDDIDASNVAVSVKNGEVRLTGTVDNRESKWRAEGLADSVGGVTEVVNEIRLRRGEQQGGPSTGSQGGQGTQEKGKRQEAR